MGGKDEPPVSDEADLVSLLQARLGNLSLEGVVDTGATLPIVSLKFAE